MSRPQRSTRTSFGGLTEHAFGTRRQATRSAVDIDKLAQNALSSVSMSVILASKDIKVDMSSCLFTLVGADIDPIPSVFTGS